ncbi:hypothetical protein KDK95_00110 [Actinospica sp. MGRD01-02]|uniref:Uncharacterized protein n=1 Tax=Actinospica acidithermotolerans TaxID=2828514 RepID=A0A941E8U9_9ACTN|nr:hypothetical protein [Actinospica acidithermotolerans]MBR7824694.1 hypothetical protein [Actinospica acidithermotolerans]
MANTARTAAKRKTETAMTRRAEEFHRREEMLSEIVAEYFDAAEQAEKARAAAHAKAQKIRARADERIAALEVQAEAVAGGHEHRADQAIGRMLELDESPRAVADTLGVPLGHVRDIQRPAQAPKRVPDTE